MNNAYSYLFKTLINERKDSNVKKEIKDRTRSIKKNEELIKSAQDRLNSIKDKKSQAALEASGAIEKWTKANENHKAEIERLKKTLDTYKDHKPEDENDEASRAADDARQDVIDATPQSNGDDPNRSTVNDANPNLPDPPEIMKNDSNHLKYQGDDKSHPLNFDSFDEYKKHILSSESDDDYDNAVKQSKELGDEIDELNKELDLNAKELKDPHLSADDKKAITERNSEIKRTIAKHRKDKIKHDDVIYSKEDALKDKYNESHNKKKALLDKAKNLNDQIDSAESSEDYELSNKLRKELNSTMDELDSHMGKKREDSSESDSDTPPSPPSDDEDNYSDDIAGSTAAAENKFNTDGTVKKSAKLAAKGLGSVLNRLGSGVHVDGTSVSDIVKNSKTREGLANGLKGLSEWRKRRVLKKLKKPFEDHLADMESAIKEHEHELKRFKNIDVDHMSSKQKREYDDLTASLKEITDERDSAKKVYDEVIQSGKTKYEKKTNSENAPNASDVAADLKKDKSDLTTAISKAKTLASKLKKLDSSKAKRRFTDISKSIDSAQEALDNNKGIATALEKITDAIKSAESIDESFYFYLNKSTSGIKLVMETKIDECGASVTAVEYLKMRG